MIGKIKIGKMSKEIAEFLKLKEPEAYTRHCYQRTLATILADAGADSA